jgi:hypothetical protein
MNQFFRLWCGRDRALRHPLDRTDPRPGEGLRGIAMDDNDGRARAMAIRARSFHAVGFETERGGFGHQRRNGVSDGDPAFRRTAPAGEQKPDHRRSSFQDFSRRATRRRHWIAPS